MVTVFSTAETGKETLVWTTTQGPDGVLYFGADGLLSFDGSRWQTAPIKGGYAVRGLDFADDGRIWAATANAELGWFARDNEPAWTFHSLRSHLPIPLQAMDPMWSVFAEKNGALFISEHRILRWDGQSFQVWPMMGGTKLRAYRVGSSILVHHTESGLYEMGAEGPQLIIPATVLADTGGIFRVVATAKGWLFIAGRGLFTYEAGRLEAVGPEASAFIRRGNLTSAVPLPDGDLAIGTLQSGMIIVGRDGTVRQTLNQANGLPSASIFSLFVDREKRLWATSTSHIFELSPQPRTTFFDQRVGLPSQPIQQIVRRGGDTVVGTEEGIFEMRADENRFHPLKGNHDRILALEAEHDGLLVAYRRSIMAMSRNNAQLLYSPQVDPRLAKRSRLMPGRIFVSEGKNIVAIDDQGSSRILVENLPDIATSIAEDARGQLWLGTFTAGVLVAQPNDVGPVTAAAPPAALGLPSLPDFGAVIATKDGTLLVLGQEGAWILGNQAQRFQPIEHYPDRKVTLFSNVLEDGSVWLIHAGVQGHPAFAGRIAVQGARATWQPHSVEGMGEIGAPHSFFAEGSAAEGTVLWVGGTKGLLRNVVPDGPSAPIPQRPLLHAFSRSTTADGMHPITEALPYSTQAVRFEFAAPHTPLRPALQLQTFIEGIDRDWIPADATATRELTAVRDGSYTFRVRTVAETGVASEPAVFDFEISPPWWRTVPAVAGVLLALTPGIYGLFRLRVRALHRRNAELEQKVGQRTAQLAKASAAKTEFVANMSHDIRNPLNGIVGLALALEDTPLGTRQRELVATLRECTTYLSSLVDDVLDFASIEAGRIELRPGPFAPAQLLRSVVTTLQGEAAERGATLFVETDPLLPPTLLGDAGRIQQILVNYAGNALKYAGGKIWLTAKLSPDSSHEIVFAVADEGPGITTADQATLFSKFHRLANARGEAIKGTGLGLAACRSLADIMGGSVGVESKREVGSTFYLRLPLTVSAPPVSAPTFNLPSATVLIVEDADYNAWAAAAVLGKLGLPCERARNGREALELFTQKRFDVVLLDRNLPDMDGTEVAKRMRQIEADNPRAILLAVTAYCTADDHALCLAAGMDAFVGKPLTPEKLQKVLLAAGRRLLTAPSVHVPPDVANVTALDLTLLTYISDGTEPGLGEQIDRFLTTLAEAEDRLEHASSARDFAVLAASAHSVLSQAKMVGGTGLEGAAAALENASRAQDSAAFGLLFDAVRREIRGLREALRRRRPETYAT